MIEKSRALWADIVELVDDQRAWDAAYPVPPTSSTASPDVLLAITVSAMRLRIAERRLAAGPDPRRDA